MSMVKSDCELILFDLGGVLVELTGVRQMLEWTRGRYSVEQLWEKWLLSSSGRLFESGRIPADDFARRMIDEFELPVPPGEFIDSFHHWISGPFPGTLDLLEELGRTYRLGSMSNTNALHWDRMLNEMGLGRFFRLNLPSHETGLVKPDREAYVNAVQCAGCEAGAIVYLDDSPLNVQAAREVGLAARRVDGLEGVKTALRELGIAVR